MLTACVNVGTKYSDDYVARLKHGIEKHLGDDHEFICFSDHEIEGVQCRWVPPELPGWWAKLYLFSLGVPLLYFDLDVVIVDDLKPLLSWEGFGILDDWWLPGFNSSVMKLTGTEDHVWSAFRLEHTKTLRQGDQQWISMMLPEAKTFPGEWFPSYKASKCQEAIPDGARAVIFHGQPRPHEVGGWVKEKWV